MNEQEQSQGHVLSLALVYQSGAPRMNEVDEVDGFKLYSRSGEPRELKGRDTKVCDGGVPEYLPHLFPPSYLATLTKRCWIKLRTASL
jgi:hypothetical protein